MSADKRRPVVDMSFPPNVATFAGVLDTATVNLDSGYGDAGHIAELVRGQPVPDTSRTDGPEHWVFAAAAVRTAARATGRSIEEMLIVELARTIDRLHEVHNRVHHAERRIEDLEREIEALRND